MSNKMVNILFFNFDEGTAFTENMIRLYSNNENFKHAYVDCQEDAVDVLRDWDNAIILAKTTDKDSLSELVSLLKIARKGVRDNYFKVGVFNSVKKKGIEAALSKRGASEFLDEAIRPKTLKFKIDFWSKTLKSKNTGSEEEKVTVSSKTGSSDRMSSNSELQIKLVDALEVECDCWILLHKNDCKKVLRKILIKLMGPSPKTGSWSEIENKNDSKNSYWKWIFLEKCEDDFYVEKGEYWYFSGNKPEFDWKTKKWNFSGNAPKLFYKTAEESISKFEILEGNVHISETSEFAQSLKDAIVESLSEDTSIENESEELDDSKEDIEGEGEALGGNYQGEVENEEFEEKEAKKSKYKEDDLGGNLEGKVGPKSNKEISSQEDFEDEDDADENELNRDKFTEEYEGHYGGKGKNEKYGEDPLSGEGSAADSDGPLSGKGSAADSYGEDPLSGKGSAADSFGEDPLSGKSSAADSFGEEPLSGKGSAADNDGPLSGKGSAADNDGPLSGEGSAADSFGEEPLSGELEASEKKEKENKKSKFKEDDLGGNYDGEGSTDSYGEDPLSGEGSAADSFGEEPLSGELEGSEKKEKENKKSKFEEDRKGGHYDNDTDGENRKADLLKGKIKKEDNADADADDIEEKEIFGAKKSFFREDDGDIEEEEDKKVDLSGFEKDVKAPKTQLMKPKGGLSLAEELEENPPTSIIDENKSPGEIDEVVEHEVLVDEDGEEVSLESGEVQVVLLKEDESGELIHHICHFEDLFESELILKAPKSIVSSDEAADIHLSFKYSKNTVSMRLKGKVVDVEVDNEVDELLTIDVENLDEEQRDKFLKLYAQRQENISKFLDKAKGVA